jgi:hypothetical protein
MNKDYLATHDLYSLATNQPFLLKEKKSISTGDDE